eukprot:9312131-Pyramimonas_sp.AAC.1
MRRAPPPRPSSDRPISSELVPRPGWSYAVAQQDHSLLAGEAATREVQRLALLRKAIRDASISFGR